MGGSQAQSSRTASAAARRLTPVWGVQSALTEDATRVEDMARKACRLARSESFAGPGEKIVIFVATPLGAPGATNLLRLAYVM